MGKLRVGIIGAGSWVVAAHLPVLLERADEVSLVGVCRSDPQAVERIREIYGFEFASTDYRDVLAAGLDLVVVASPTGQHHTHAMAALESGAHVLLEKPMTIRSADAWEIAREAARRDRHLVLSFGWNHMPMVRTAVDAVRRIGIGRLEHLTIHMSSQTRELLTNTGAYPDASPESLPRAATWTDPSQSGGGYGQAQLSHALALGLALVSDDVVGAFALMTNGGGTPVELHDAAALRFGGGGIGVLAGASSHRGAWDDKHQLEVRAVGSDGQFIVDVHRELVWVYRADGTDYTADLAVDAGRYDPYGPANTILDLVLERTEHNPATGTLGARTVGALELLYESARTGQWAGSRD